MVPIFLGHHYM